MESQPDIIGYVGTGISVVGAIGALVFGQPAMAGIPVAIGVGCNMLSRNQLSKILVESHNQNQVAIAELKELLVNQQNELNSTIQTNQANLSEQFKSLQQEVNNKLDTTKGELNYQIEDIKTQHEKLADIVGNLRDIESLSQELRVAPNSADFYYQRGINQQNLGNKHGAVEDYSEAIKQNFNFAPAYHKRGVVYLDLGERQNAVDDLRKAALLYFEQGDIESYQKAREMSRNIHNLKSNLNGHQPEIIVSEQLFSEK